VVKPLKKVYSRLLKAYSNWQTRPKNPEIKLKPINVNMEIDELL
jgi:hypothetical protein